MTLLPAFLLPILLGFALVTLFWGRDQTVPESFLLKTSLSVGLGFGLTSALYFAWILIVGRFGMDFILLESGLFLVLAATVFMTRPRYEGFRFFRKDGSAGKIGVRQLFAFSFYGILALSMLAFLYLSLNRPHGGWDAWAMWNMRARFLFHGGDHWRDVFSVVGELHLDYPFLVPGVVARVWSYAGSDTTGVPAVASLVFTLTTVLLLSSSLNHLRGGAQGYVAGIALPAASGFILRGASQYADVYVGFFFLAAFVIYSLATDKEKENRGLTVLAGTAAALAAWTKNEGIVFLFLFFAAGTIASVIFDGAKAGLRRLAFFAAGALPVGFLLLYFKAGLAPPADLLAGQQGGGRCSHGSWIPPVTRRWRRRFLSKACGSSSCRYGSSISCFWGWTGARARRKGFLVSLATLLGMFFYGFSCVRDDTSST
jgi:hypothetical protein